MTPQEPVGMEQAMKRIRMQIKYGRAVEAGSALRSLLDRYKDTDDEKTILEVYALGLLKDTESYATAIPVLERLLALDIDERVRAEAAEFLQSAIAYENRVPSEPDASNPDFLEFMRIVRSGTLFDTASAGQGAAAYVIVADLDTAQRLAWDQQIDAPFESWNDLRTEASKQIHTHYSRNKLTMATLDAVGREIGAICASHLSSVMMHFYDDIEGDLTMIAMGKLAGVVPDLHVHMWQAYRQCVYPCGWRGEFPDGQLCVFPNQ